MHEGTANIDIDASAEEIFAVIADLESYPEWLADIKEVEVEGHDAQGYPTASTMTVDVTIREVSYTLEYEWMEPERVSWVSREGGDVKHIAGSYVLTVNDDGSTHVQYDLAMDPGFPVPGFMVKRAARHIVSQALKGLKARVEES